MNAGLLYAVDWLLMRALFRLTVRGIQQVPDAGPVVLVSNHASHLDPFAIAAALPLARLRGLYWGGWTGVAFSNPVARYGSRIAQVIPIDPRRGVRMSLALSAAVLACRRGLIWFPEGHRSRSGELQSLRPGIGLLLAHHPVPVVPVAIHGSHAALPPGRFLPRPHRLTVHFGEALDPRRLAEEGEGEEAAQRIVHALGKRMAELLRQ